MRLVVVKIGPHVSGGKYKGGSSGVDSDGFLRIATNLLDVPAEIIALVYAYRWTIEIFFRQFKHLLGCRHLLSHNQNGITIQTDCAIIACLVDRPLDRTQANEAHSRDGLFPHDRLGDHRRNRSPPRETQTHRRQAREKSLI